ncbi:MAG: hypothetical protein QOF86_329 [Baekduia sp.]|nr:hypothetical protein [Baekduia sp.]
MGAAALGDGGATMPWMAGAVLSAGVAMGLLALGPRLQARRAVAARAAAVAA